MLNVIVLGGENPVLIREELENLSSSFQGDKTVRYGDELNPEEFFADISTGSLFAATRFFLVHHAETASPAFERLLLSYLADPLDSVCLVLEYEGKIPSKIESASQKLGSSIGKVVSYKRPYAEDQKSYLRIAFQKAGIKAPPSALDLIVQLAGGDIEETASMARKLTDYLGERSTLTDEDVISTLERVKNASIFDLTDAVFARSTAKALTAFNDLLAAGEALPAINAMLLRSARIMWTVKCSPGGIMPQGFACSPYEWKKALGLARNISLRFVSRMTECIASLEISSKTFPETHSRAAVEEFLLQLDTL